jgi:hypothetical protein
VINSPDPEEIAFEK